MLMSLIRIVRTSLTYQFGPWWMFELYEYFLVHLSVQQ